MLSVKNLDVSYGDTLAVKKVSFDVAEGEFVTLLGPSGCGKTTTLRSIAGLVSPTDGTIGIGGKEVFGPKTIMPPERRGLNMVFQSYAIWPHLTVYDNVAYGLKIAKLKREDIGNRVDKVLETVNLAGYSKRYPAELSGGQQQRVALARAIVTQPKVLLLDEPLSNLDSGLRIEMRSQISGLQRELGITTLYVTHDQDEAMAMSDRIILMNDGRIEQESPPRELYDLPRTDFAASFIGVANVVPSSVDSTSGQDGRIDALLLNEYLISRCTNLGAADGEGLAVIRPEHISVSRIAANDVGIAVPENNVDGVVQRVEFLGNRVEAKVEVAGEFVFETLLPADTNLEVGDYVRLKIDASKVVLI